MGKPLKPSSRVAALSSSDGSAIELRDAVRFRSEAHAVAFAEYLSLYDGAAKSRIVFEAEDSSAQFKLWIGANGEIQFGQVVAGQEVAAPHSAVRLLGDDGDTYELFVEGGQLKTRKV